MTVDLAYFDFRGQWWLCFWQNFHLYKVAATAECIAWVVARWGTNVADWPSPYTVYFDNP